MKKECINTISMAYTEWLTAIDVLLEIFVEFMLAYGISKEESP